MVQDVVQMPSKYEALSWNPGTDKKEKKNLKQKNERYFIILMGKLQNSLRSIKRKRRVTYSWKETNPTKVSPLKHINKIP
jgi:hypothetical protein